MRHSITTTRRTQVRIAAGIAAIAAISGVTVAAVAETNPAGDQPASPKSNGAVVTVSVPSPTTPDLTDPETRRRFVCSFAAGAFGIPFEGPPADASYCADDVATNTGP